MSHYVYATKQNVPDYIAKGGIAYRVITDQLGSVRQVVNVATGEIVQQMDYDEYGNVINSTGQQILPMGFAGGLYDCQTGLVRYGARDYEALSGRWTTKDPILFKSKTTNHYMYASNNPVNLIDAVGTSEINWGQAAAAFQFAASITAALNDIVDIAFSKGGVDLGIAITCLATDLGGAMAAPMNFLNATYGFNKQRQRTDPLSDFVEILGAVPKGVALTGALVAGAMFAANLRGFSALDPQRMKLRAVVVTLSTISMIQAGMNLRR